MPQVEQGFFPEISRRGLFKVAGAALFVAACENRPAAPGLYNGPIPDLKGRPLVSNERFEELTKALSDSGQPLLERVAGELEEMHTEKTNPQDLPSIVSEKSAPLAITRDNSEFALASVYVLPDESSSGFLLDTGSELQIWPYSKPAILGINIVTNEKMERRDPIDESLYLAKEYLSLMVIIRMFQDYERMMPEGHKFLELDGSRMLDTDAIMRAGMSVGSYELGDERSGFWKMADIVPALIMIPSIINLIIDEKLPERTDTLTSFYGIVNMVYENEELMDLLWRLSDDWYNSPSIIGPEDLVEQLKNPILRKAVNDIYDQAYPDRAS
ncbi:MAG: hypothetical protein HY426_04590 [Candidatus Levybacteria bacterium]|nr:hypothetical protein [Candidatus Levybacteria bacterium]